MNIKLFLRYKFDIFYFIIMGTLNIATWNATGIMSGASYAGDMLKRKEIHFLGISEHWLYRQNLHFIDSINANYTGFGVCDNDLMMPSSRKIGKGGVALLWHRALNNNVTPLDIDSDRICGIQYRLSKNSFFYIFQVYAPCSSHSIHVYREFIDDLNAVISMYCQNGLVMVLGDFNAHLQGKRYIKVTDERGNYLLDMMHYHNLVSLNTLSMCKGATSSFISYGDLYESLIDHILFPVERVDTISYCEILAEDMLNVSRHMPIVCSVSVPMTDFEGCNYTFPSHIKWDKLDEATITQYKSELESMLVEESCFEGISIETKLDRTYSHIADSIIKASDLTLPKSKFRPYLKPYWDRALKDLHAGMREKRRKWISEGRPRGTTFLSYKEYKTAKSLFRAHHRRCVENFLMELNFEIDEAAEVDSAVFWKKVNSKRKTSQTSAGSEIKFRDRIYRDPAEIAVGWGNYFCELYSDTERNQYDQQFKNCVEEKVKNITTALSACRDGDTAYISADEVRKAIMCLKKKKACSHDQIYNEHLINGGFALYEKLAKFYTEMYNFGYIPAPLKQGIIITLHKGGRKSKTDPNNYRAITLSSVILKLFERLLLERVEKNITKPLNWLQGGFRANIGCNMTSVMLRECILYARENGSKLYVCYLDVQKAFDRVWHSGLFLKLFEMGIQRQLLRIIIELHSGMKSCVLYKGHKSNWFEILQGTRQGGVLSPLMYLCFVNDLLIELTSCKFGLSIFGKNMCSPTVADDMLLSSLSKKGLDELMAICYRYSCKWRFEYQPSKCSVIVYNETKYEYLRSDRKWLLGNSVIEEEESYRHLGVITNKYLKLKLSIKDSADKLKGTFLSLVNSGIFYDNSLHPITSRKIYNSVVLPKALYGCESWCPLTASNLLTLERAHRFCVKHMQSLGIRTRTDIALGLLGIFPLEIEIEIRKLILFGQLCRLSSKYWVKNIFLNRLLSYKINPYKQTGFIPDIEKILNKYQLTHVLDMYFSDGIFPGQLAWKRMLKSNVKNSAVANWHTRISAPEFSRFKSIHTDFQPNIFWLYSKEKRKLLAPCTSVIQMISNLNNTPYDGNICPCCNLMYENIIDHCIHECLYLNRERAIFWNELSKLDLNVYMFLNIQEPVFLSNIFLGQENLELSRLLQEKGEKFKRICIFNLHFMWYKYKSY